MDVFGALAQSRRREIVEMLADRGQMSATDISDQFKVTAAAISQHLKVLREAKIVKMEKKAQQRLYGLNPESLDGVEEWARKMKLEWQSRLDRLERVLEKKEGE